MRGAWRWVVVVVVVLAAAAASVPARAGEVNLNVYTGPRYLDKDFWDPIEDQYAIGGTVDFAKQGAPVHFALGLHNSIGVEDFNDPVIDSLVGGVTELSFGVAKVFKTAGKTRPFVSGGASFVRAEAEADTFAGNVDDNDESLGLWIEGGVYWRLTHHFNLGVHARTLLGTSVTLFDVDGDADYWQFGPMIGWSWPAQP